MRYRNLMVPVGAGLALFALAVLLCTGGLFSFTTDLPETPAPPENGSPAVSDADEPAAGGLFVLRPGAETPTDWRATLEGRGMTVGSPTGDGGHLVRVPAGVAPDAEGLPGATLRPHAVGDRVATELQPLLEDLRTGETAPRAPAAEPTPDTAPGPNADRVTVTVSLFDAADKQATAALVRRLGGTIRCGLGDAEAAAIRVSLPADGLPQLAAAPETVYIEGYRPPQLLNDRARDVIAAAPVSVPRFITRAGLSGAGQIVALADSGVDKGSLSDLHPDLTGPPGEKQKIVSLSPFSGGDPADPIGHGTHMAGTIVGTGAASGGKYRGVAPEAGLFAQSILNPQGDIDPPADLVSLFRPAYQAGARIHVNGWGGRTNAYLGAAAQADRFVRYYPDFLVIFGAGNDGPFTNTLTPEANSKNALVVGASQSPRPYFGSDSAAVGDPALFSSRGPAADGRIKPELVVPGSAVISAKSGLVEGNFEANPAYTRMQGTSMSAAVAGGAAALVREYLQKQQDLSHPASALLKALLINGARPLPNGPAGSGYGLMNLTGTLLALEEGAFQYGQNDSVGTGGTRTYTFKVEQGDAPFKATLAWTDPAATPGARKALVNDLDLMVVGPDGAEYLGNDPDRRGVRDNINNVEQVRLEDPAPGIYKVVVRGASVTENVKPDSPRPVQDFAVVYGRLPLRETVADGNSRSLTLADGSRVDLSAGRVSGVTDARTGLPADAAGADAYLFGPRSKPTRACLIAREWQAGAVKGISLDDDRFLLVQIDRQNRDGGYHFVPDRPVSVNGKPVENPAGIPVGAHVTGWLNPSTQEVWKIEAGYREQYGMLAAIDYPAHRIRLLNDDREYVLSDQAAIAFNQNIIGGDRHEIPFGAAMAVQTPSPGVGVRMVLTPRTNVVNYLVCRRQAVVGALQDVSVGADGGGAVMLAGQRYTMLPGCGVEKDGHPATPAMLEPGDLILATVVEGSRQVIQVTAHTAVMHGQLIYAGRENIYLSDYWGDMHTLRLSRDTAVFRWDMSGDASLLSPGLMVRVVLEPGTKDACRIDIAEEHTDLVAVVASFDPDRGVLHTDDGESYPVTANTIFTKNGLPVRAADLRAGEPITLTVLSDPADDMVPVRGSVTTKPGVTAPTLQVESVVPLSDRYIVRGTTTADQLYAGIEKPDLRQLQVATDGTFYWSVPFGSRAGEGQLVALDSRTGGVVGRTVGLPARTEPERLPDIQHSWARDDIEHLLARGLVSGYPDGSFRPHDPVTRTEFTILLARLLGPVAGEESPPPFRDASLIPDWARDTIMLAQKRGLASGYEDGTFRPYHRVNRAEAAALLVRGCAVLGISVPAETELPRYMDWATVPEWARRSVADIFALGLMRGRDDHFAPHAALSRAEAAAILNRLLQKIEAGDRQQIIWCKLMRESGPLEHRGSMGNDRRLGH